MPPRFPHRYLPDWKPLLVMVLILALHCAALSVEAQQPAPAPHAPVNKPVAEALSQSPSPAGNSASQPPFLLTGLAGVALMALGGLGFLAYKMNALRKELEAERQKSQQAQQRLESQALYDTLTHLPNRRLFWDRLLHTIKLANRSRTRFMIIMADLDKFKPINDTMGHDAGDIALKEVARRLQAAIRDSDTLARLGGDEFAFICPSAGDRGSASTVCMRILSAMQPPVMVQGKECQMGISLGIAAFPDHATDAEILVRRADTALYRAKEKRNTFVFYDPQIDQPKSQASPPPPGQPPTPPPSPGQPPGHPPRR